MKKIKVLTIAVVLMLLGGCSFLGEVNDTIDYVDTATSHLQQLSSFAENAPQLIQEAANDPEAKQELENQLMTLQTEVEGFINTEEIPAIAEGIHEELVKKNEVLLEEMNNVIENGHIALDKLENSEIVTTINNVTELLDRLESLGQ